MVTVSLWFGIDSHRLTSHRKSLMHWASRPCVSNVGSSYLKFKGMDETSLRQHFIVVDLMAVLSVVLICSRCRAQSFITLFLPLWTLQDSEVSMSMSWYHFTPWCIQE